MDSNDTTTDPSAYDLELRRADSSQAAVPEVSPAELECRSCREFNPAINLHCEHCGALLASASATSVASESRKAIALAVAALFLIAVSISVVAFIANAPRSDSEVGAVDSTATTTETPEQVRVGLLTPLSAEASSELGDFHASHLIDGDVTSYWNDASLQGQGAELTFRFDHPVIITAIEFVNVPGDESRRRNFRIRAFEIIGGAGSEPISGQLDDTSDAQRIDVGRMETQVLEIHIVTTYPAEPFGGAVPFDEVALAEVRFLGIDSP